MKIDDIEKYQKYGGVNPKRWKPGDIAYYEYHCDQSDGSVHAHLWYRSHQPVTIIALVQDGAQGTSYLERAEGGLDLRMYSVRFQDGLVDEEILEDELLVSPKFFSPEYAPPNKPKPDHIK